uniref:Uncharacterized protein n=1 Tax=Arundo donax TaxID=35708 RepID=A0A0A8YL08_ARUDO
MVNWSPSNVSLDWEFTCGFQEVQCLFCQMLLILVSYGDFT